MEKINFDDYASNYHKIMQEQHAKFGDVAYYSEYKVQIVKNLCYSFTNVRILEYGCGIGLNLPYLQKAFPNSNIYGFDISKESLELAQKQNPTVTVIEENNIKKYEQFFDLIFVAGVYHHINPLHRQGVTDNIARLLKTDGIVIVFEHNPKNPITRHLVNTCEFDKDAVLLAKSELENIFEMSGLKCKKSGYCLFIPPRFKKINFIEKYLKNLPIGGQYYIEFKK